MCKPPNARRRSQHSGALDARLASDRARIAATTTTALVGNARAARRRLVALSPSSLSRHVALAGSRVVTFGHIWSRVVASLSALHRAPLHRVTSLT
eukprot:1181834-Prorocentrum_minimum.AAC.3